MELTFSALALLVGIAAAIVSGLSWRAAVQAIRASIFQNRFEVYQDAERFLTSWIQKGCPDTDNELRVLVGAWNRSHFLFDQDVTDYLRELWLDGIKANYAQHVISGEYEGNRDEAIKTKYDLLNKHCAEDSLLRKIFVKHMKV